MKRYFSIALFIFLGMKLLSGATYTVVNTNETGAGSLRAAIESCLANPYGAPHTVQFQIPLSDPGYSASTGIWEISFTDEGLPPLTVSFITIDGTTQTAFAGNTNPNGPEIMLNGSQRTVEYCISIQNASHVTIKHLIINEFLYGIQIYGQNTSHNKVVGCYLGCNSDGTQLMGNVNAIEIISGAHHNQIGDVGLQNRNLISGNEYAGIRMSDAHNNLVINNWVGVDRTGTVALRNYDGITVEGAGAYNQIGGSSIDSANVTAGNVAYGVDIFGVGCIWNRVSGNYIGTDPTGTYAIPNTYGLLCDDRSNHNIIGGYLPGQGNLISGNTAFGAYFYNNGTSYMQLIGNKIGTDITGTYAIPNETGVHIDGASYANLVDNNLISGNLANGITLFGIYSDYNSIIRNKIGTDITGTQAIGNGLHGILVTQNAANNSIGGHDTLANIIAFNGRNGVKIESFLSQNILISCNSFFQNSYLGIEIFPDDGPNQNDVGDVDDGPNKMLNKPVIQGITYTGNTATIWGNIDVQQPSTTKIEIYKAEINPYYISEGAQYTGFTYPDAQGNWTYSFTIQSTGNSYTTLAIDSARNTSEFSLEYPQHLTFFTLTHSVVGGNGTLTAWSDGSVLNPTDSVQALRNIYLTAFPDSLYKVKEWRINGAVVNNNQTNYAMISGIEEHTDITVEFEINTTHAEVHNMNNGAVLMYPNPIRSGGHLNLSNMKGVTNIVLYDLTGREICSEVPFLNSNQIYSLKMSGRPGVYFVEIRYENSFKYVQKIIICE